MAKEKKEVIQTDNVDNVHDNNFPVRKDPTPTIHSIEWTDYVLGQLTDDEKIGGNPTTDGLRRIFEKVMDAKIISSTSHIVQSPSPDNEKRATVCHSITFRLNPLLQNTDDLNTITVDGSADVYWGNCDKVYRNHPVAVAETRAEGRALRRALRLRKVVAAEEISKEIEDNPDANSVSKISTNQVNFIDVLAQRMDINVTSLIASLAITESNVYNMTHEDAVRVVQQLTSYQQDVGKIPNAVLGYQNNWK